MFFAENDNFVIKDVNEPAFEEVVKCKAAALINFTVNDRAKWLHKITGEIKRIVFVAMINSHGR